MMGRGDLLAALATLSERAAVAGASAGHASVRHCPGWTVDDLVTHLAQVQWFWADVAGRCVVDGDDVVRPPDRPPDVASHAWLRQQTVRLVGALAVLDDETPLWTWSEPHQHAAFVLRRQVVEAAVHCFDAELAAGSDWTLPIGVAELGLIEFIEVFQRDTADGVALRPLKIHPTDVPWSGTVFAEASGEPVTLSLPAAEALLALWGRYDVDDPTVASLIDAVDRS